MVLSLLREELILWLRVLAEVMQGRSRSLLLTSEICRTPSPGPRSRHRLAVGTSSQAPAIDKIDLASADESPSRCLPASTSG